MKIALVVHDFDRRYGQGRYAVELARRLAPRHQIHVFANTFGAIVAPGITCHRVGAWRSNALLGILTFLCSVERHLGRTDFDVVHAQGLSSWRADVITAHICNRARLDQSVSQNQSARVFQRAIATLESSFYQQSRAKYLIAVSRHTAQDIAAHYNWKRPSTVIYHGIDTVDFHPNLDAVGRSNARKHFGLNSDGWVWLFAGEASKGLARVINQLREFSDAQLLVVSRSSLEPHERLARSIGVHHRIRFHGPEETMNLAYNASDVLVYPSDYDAFALIVGEAMASSLPVIVGQNIGAAEWIQPEINGLLCDPIDAGSLGRQIRWLQSDSVRANALGKAARETAMKHEWDDCASATEAVYKAAIGKGIE